ncbi:MAG: NUDIX domain-containing protein [Actinobacteria bacterium]|nr:NUDIX domain-containing protein [Actinomycetota bacterium]MCA1720925.1 NUDIX domain-containing protein [Actinomycetota bacterium]
MVVLDPDGWVLLLRYDDPPPMGVHWSTPGGGLEPGESPREAAVRELREETGWTDVAVGDELGITQRVVVRARVQGQVETHFVARVDEPRRPVSAAGHAADSIAAWGWFAPDALPPEPVWPVELPSYLARLRHPS